MRTRNLRDARRCSQCARTRLENRPARHCLVFHDSFLPYMTCASLRLSAWSGLSADLLGRTAKQQFNIATQVVDARFDHRAVALGFRQDERALQHGLGVQCETFGRPWPAEAVALHRLGY